MPIKAPAGSAVAFCGWCCGYGTKSTPKSAPTGSDKVWAIYRHPSSRKVYTIYGKYRSGTLEGLRHSVHSKGKILTDAAFKSLIDTKVRGGYRCGNAKARDFAAQLRRAGFAVARSAKATASPRTTPAKRRRAASPRTTPAKRRRAASPGRRSPPRSSSVRSPKQSPRPKNNCAAAPTEAALRKLMRTHAVTGGRTKLQMAEALMRVRGTALPTAALEAILPLLRGPSAAEARRVLRRRAAAGPVTSYRGLWQKRPKAVAAMKRDELITHLRAFRNAWERVTQRDQDLSNARLQRETVAGLRSLLAFYYSDTSRVLAEEWLTGAKHRAAAAES